MFWICLSLIIQCISFTLSATTPGPQEEMVDIATVDTNMTDLVKGMPKSLSFTLNAMNAKGPIILNLKLKKTINEKSFVYVIRQDKNGAMVLVKENIPVKENIGLYQDRATGAAITVKCVGLQDGHCNPVLFGSIHINDTEYDLSEISTADITNSNAASFSPTQPSPAIAGRVKRHANKGDKTKKWKRKGNKDKQRRKTEKSKKKTSRVMEKNNRKIQKASKTQQRRIYKLMKKKRKSFFNKDDFVVLSNEDPKNSLIKKETSARLGTAMPFLTESKTVDISKENQPRVLGRSMVSTSVKRNEVSPDDTYNVELLIVVDYAIYEREYNKVTSGTSRTKDIEAKSRIRQYFAHVVNGINLRYDSIDTSKFHINVAVSGYIIADRPEISVWTASAKNGLLESKEALDSLRSWRLNIISLPEHDHMMLFTALDLYRFDVSRNQVTGLASFKAMCSASSTSVVEDNGVYGSMSTGTHELAHSLGVQHDGSGNVCSSNSKFIMATTGGITDEVTELNPWRFSPCSIDELDNFLKGLGPGNCLKDEALVYDMDEFNQVTRNEAGQVYDPNEQCRQRAGKNSFYGWGGGLGEYRDICTSMACKSDTSDTSYLIHTAVRGTSCGNKQWCMDGQCVYDDKAPVRDALCVHGDSQRLFEGQTCTEMIKADPSKCYEDYYKEFCCKSCQDIQQPIRGCEFGDKNANCKTVLERPHLCYSSRNEDICCSSCKRINTKYTGCEYGDKVHEVFDGACYEWRCPGNPDYQKACCKTCGLIPDTPIIDPSMGGPSTQSPKRTTTKVPFGPPTTEPFPSPPNPAGPSIITGLPTQPDRPQPTTEPPTTTPRPVVPTNPQPTQPRPVPTQPKPVPTQPKPRPTEPKPRPTEYCPLQDGMFRSLTCTTLARWMTKMCDNIVLRSICCEPCSKPVSGMCEDKENCINVKGRNCYDSYIRGQCCRTCKAFETGDKDCMFGDTVDSCRRLMSNWADYVCTRHAESCCGSCKSFKTDTPNIILSRNTENLIKNTLDQQEESPFRPSRPRTNISVNGVNIQAKNTVVLRGDQQPDTNSTDTNSTVKRRKQGRGRGRGWGNQRRKNDRKGNGWHWHHRRRWDRHYL